MTAALSRSLRLLALPWLVLFAGGVQALDARAFIERAIDLMDQGQFAFARVYLDPALIAPQLDPGERARAYYLRGFSFLGEDMPVSARKDFNRALEFNPSNPAVLVELGRLHLTGRGVEPDPGLAFSLFEQAATLDYPPAHFHVGYAYLHGQGVEKNLDRARELLERAAAADNVFAMTSLASSYRAQHADPPQPEVAAEWYRKASEAGEPKALVSLGYMYRNGEFGEPDKTKAVALFREAAQAGVPAAQVSLAYAYLVGEGVEEDAAQALALYESAANAGEAAAYIGLGHLYEHGLAVKRDTAAALEWYERAADLGLVDAQLRMVSVYLKKDGPEAREQALHWSRVATGSGSAQAYNDYAWLLATSRFADFRNGTLAVDQASRAVQAQPSAAYLDTLAAAYAEIGNFEQAVATQRQALAALQPDEGDFRRELERRLEYYQRSQPWRE